MTSPEITDAAVEDAALAIYLCADGSSGRTLARAALAAALPHLAAGRATAAPSDAAQIKHMVERFLRWKLPENYRPDGGISFERDYNQDTPWPAKHEPSGTNLFNYGQATEMVRFMVEGLPPAALAAGRAEAVAAPAAEAEPVAWPSGFFAIGGDARLRDCATEGCGQHVSIRVERGGVGSDHCEPCARKIAAALAQSDAAGGE
jgi:hypothetical protein